MITFAVEQWDDVHSEAIPSLLLHYEEVGQDKTHMKFDPDYGRYKELADSGSLHIVTARSAGELVGYHVSIISRLLHSKLHSKTALAAISDIYWLRKDCRNGTAAIRLFQEVEKTLKARGVHVLYDSTKLYLDHDRLFMHLGFKAIERRYSKWIGD